MFSDHLHPRGVNRVIPSAKRAYIGSPPPEWRTCRYFPIIKDQMRSRTKADELPAKLLSLFEPGGRVKVGHRTTNDNVCGMCCQGAQRLFFMVGPSHSAYRILSRAHARWPTKSRTPTGDRVCQHQWNLGSHSHL